MQSLTAAGTGMAIHVHVWSGDVLAAALVAAVAAAVSHHDDVAADYASSQLALQLCPTGSKGQHRTSAFNSFCIRSCLIRLVRRGWVRLRAGRGAAYHAAAVRGQPGAVCGHVRRLQARHQLRHPLLVQRQHLPVNPCVQGRTCL